MTVLSRPLRRLSRGSTLAAVCAITAACGSGSDVRTTTDDLPAVGDAQLQLERSSDCGELLTRIQDSVLVQLELRAEQLKQGEGAYSGPGIAIGNGVGVGVDSSAPPRAAEAPGAGGGTSSGGAAPVPTDNGNPGDQATAEGGEESSGSGFSGTTVQVKDVDEADIVKADGDDIYLLHGGTLFVLRGWPADATEILGSSVVEGTPSEMFVKDGKAVVFSSVYAGLANGATGQAANGYASASYTKLSVFDVSLGTPSLLRESYVEGDYTSARRHDDVVRAVVQDGFKIPQFAYPSIEYRDAFGDPYPQVDVDAQVDAWLQRTARSIRGTDLGDWLPREFAKQSGALVAVAPRCGDYYSPDPGLTQTGVTSIVSLDLADPSAPLAGATILGRAERVYSNEDVLLITQADYRYSYDAAATEQTIIHRFDLSGAATTYTASGVVAGSIHDQFSLDERDGIIRVSTTEQTWGGGRGGPPIDLTTPATPPTTASDPSSAPGAGGAGSGGATSGAAGSSAAGAAGTGASAPGSAGEGSSPPGAAEAPSTDAELPGPVPDLLPSQTPPPPDQPSSVSRVSTLHTVGDTLEVLGTTADFGPNERIVSTRFIGERGYVVTFRQTDPLFVVDLSDPADPHVAGELVIPGFSDYLFPLDDDHLFAIGRDATAQGVVQGLALQIFDVSDATQPALTQRYVFPDLGDSPANVDHRAISFHPDRGVVAFPHQSYATGESTLEVFQISSETGFARLGGMSMSETVDLDQCLAKFYSLAPEDVPALRAQIESDVEYENALLAKCASAEYFRRGLFRGDFVYGIGSAGISVYDFTAMGAGAVSELRLPAEVYDGSGGYASGGSSAGVAPPGSATPTPDTASDARPVSGAAKPAP